MNNTNDIITPMATDRSHKSRLVIELNSNEIIELLKVQAILGGYGTAKNAVLEALYKEFPALRTAIDTERGSAYVRRTPSGGILDMVKDRQAR